MAANPHEFRHTSLVTPTMSQDDQDMSHPFLKQEEDGVESENGTWSDAPPANRRPSAQKRFIISLILNGALLVLLVVGYAVLRAGPKNQKLLPTPVPECTSYSSSRWSLAKICQFPGRSEPSSWTPYSSLSQLRRATRRGSPCQAVRQSLLTPSSAGAPVNQV